MSRFIDLLIPPVPLEESCSSCPGDRQKQLKIGTELEKEHFRNGKLKDKTPRAVAKTHLGENPKYYPKTKKPKGSLETLKWVKS